MELTGDSDGARRLQPSVPSIGCAQPPLVLQPAVRDNNPGDAVAADPPPALAARGGQHAAALLPCVHGHQCHQCHQSHQSHRHCRRSHLRGPAVLVEVQVAVLAQEQLSPPALAVAHHWERRAVREVAKGSSPRPGGTRGCERSAYSPAMRLAMVAVGTNRADSVPRIAAARRCSSAREHGCAGGWRWGPGAWGPHRSRPPSGPLGPPHPAAPASGACRRGPRGSPSPPPTVHCRVLPVVVVARGGAGHGTAHCRARPGHRVAPQVHGKRRGRGGTPRYPPRPEQPPPPQHRPHRRDRPPQGLPGGGGIARAGIARAGNGARRHGPGAGQRLGTPSLPAPHPSIPQHTENTVGAAPALHRPAAPRFARIPILSVRRETAPGDRPKSFHG